MEAEGGCFSRKKNDMSKSSKGLPIVQPTEDIPNNRLPPQKGNYCSCFGRTQISFLNSLFNSSFLQTVEF